MSIFINHRLHVQAMQLRILLAADRHTDTDTMETAIDYEYVPKNSEAAVAASLVGSATREAGATTDVGPVVLLSASKFAWNSGPYRAGVLWPPIDSHMAGR